MSVLVHHFIDAVQRRPDLFIKRRVMQELLIAGV